MVHQMTGDDAIFWPGGNALRVDTQEVEPKRRRFPKIIDLQVVLTGRAADIDRLVDVVAAKEDVYSNGVGPIRLKRGAFAVMRVNDFFEPTDMERYQQLQKFQGIEVRLYDITAPKEFPETEGMVLEMMRAIYETAATMDPPCIVFADPNLITGNPNTGGTGGVSGGPLGNTGKIRGRDRDPKEVFLDHWAFSRPDKSDPFSGRGINLEEGRDYNPVAQASQDEARKRMVDETGAGTRVFILDGFPSNPNLPGMERLQTRVSYLDPVVPIQCSLDMVESLDIHGMYVAGLLQRVAPGASLHVVRILNEEGKGEVFTLSSALARVAAHALRSPVDDNRLPLGDVVINLSLAADLSEDQVVAVGVRKAIEDLWKKAQPGYDSWNVLHRLLDDIVNKFAYMPCIRLSVQILNCLGAVVVASAGNESASVYGHLPLGVPARYPEVIGVAASNYLGKLSSFSNSADLMAPGGGTEYPEAPITDINDLDKPSIDLSRYAMTSIVPETTPKYASGLAYWWGTSFSAPLVSGLAALVQQAYRQAPKAKIPTPEEVGDIIRKRAYRGVIDVQSTLQAVRGSPLPQQQA